VAPQLASRGARNRGQQAKAVKRGAVCERRVREKEVMGEEGGIECFIAVSSGEGTPCSIWGGRVPVCGFGGLCTDRAISRKTGLPVPEEHLLAVVGRHF
jgi:hypothetical protein